MHFSFFLLPQIYHKKGQETVCSTREKWLDYQDHHTLRQEENISVGTQKKKMPPSNSLFCSRQFCDISQTSSKLNQTFSRSCAVFLPLNHFLVPDNKKKLFWFHFPASQIGAEDDNLVTALSSTGQTGATVVFKRYLQSVQECMVVRLYK